MAQFFEDSEKLRAYVAEQQGGVTLLSFSGGKDSLGAWLALRERFERIVPVYLYPVPGLAFIERGLAYFEDVFQTHIYRLPHPSFYRWLHNAVFQAPENLPVLDVALQEGRLPQYDYQEAFDVIRLHLGLPLETYCAVGVRAVDSINRWVSIKTHGALNEQTFTWYPIYDWRKDQLVETIRASGVKLPQEYRWFGRSFDGLDYRFLLPIREHYPDDYERIIQWFPLAEAEIQRQAYRRRFYGEK